jgi:hypothetical protein
MDTKAIIAIIEKRRAEYFDRQLIAGSGSSEDIVESAQRAWDFVQEYDSLLEEIKGLEEK